ncbi:MAG: S16 family serine protease [Candidatus Methanodesulfokora sp.]
MRKPVILLLLLVLTAQIVISSPQKVYQVTISAPAVMQTENGTVGVLSNLTVTVSYPGSGKVYFSAEPLTDIDTQGSARVAAFVACYLLGKDFNSYDFFYLMSSKSTIIGGPSAGAAMTVATMAALMETQPRKDVIMTGMINPDGTVGPVGGIPEKLRAAAEGGAKIFLIPAGQRVVTESRVERTTIGIITIMRTVQSTVDLVELGNKLGVNVIEVSDVAEAFKYFTGMKIEVPEIQKLGLPESAKSTISSWVKMYLNNVSSMNEKSINLSSKLSSSQRAYISSLVGDSRKYAKNALDLIDKGFYYTAASAAFQSALYSEMAYETALYLTEGKSAFERAFKEVNLSLDALYKEIINLRPSLEGIDVISAAWIRYYDAKRNLELSSSAYSNGLIFDKPTWGSVQHGAIYYLAYAKWRAITAKTWLSLYKQGSAISQTSLRSIANVLIYGAETSLSYAYTLYSGTSNSLLDESQQKLSDARDAYSDGNYIAALGLSVEAISDATTAIHAVYYTDMSTAINGVKKSALAAISRAKSGGIEPLLAMSYYELASYYEKSDPLTSLSLYEMSAVSAMSLEIASRAKGYQVNLTPVAPTTPLQNRTVNKTAEIIASSTSNYLFMVVCFLIGLMLGVLIRRK